MKRFRQGYGLGLVMIIATVAVLAFSATPVRTSEVRSEQPRSIRRPHWRIVLPTTTTTAVVEPSVETPPTDVAVARVRQAPTSEPSYDDGSGVAGCIRKYESGGLVDTDGSNDHRDGYYQIIPSTWDGYGGYATAQEAPRSVQDERFEQLWAESHHHWDAQKGRCW